MCTILKASLESKLVKGSDYLWLIVHSERDWLCVVSVLAGKFF